MATFYYHYTSRETAQDIYCTRMINNPITGDNYITPELYTSGAEAAQALSIMRKPVEVGYAIPEYVLHSILAGPVPMSSIVLGITNPATGTLMRQGGGNEIIIQAPITSNPIFQSINLTSP